MKCSQCDFSTTAGKRGLNIHQGKKHNLNVNPKRDPRSGDYFVNVSGDDTPGPSHEEGGGRKENNKRPKMEEEIITIEDSDDDPDKIQETGNIDSVSLFRSNLLYI